MEANQKFTDSTSSSRNNRPGGGPGGGRRGRITGIGSIQATPGHYLIHLKCRNIDVKELALVEQVDDPGRHSNFVLGAGIHYEILHQKRTESILTSDDI